MAPSAIEDCLPPRERRRRRGSSRVDNSLEGSGPATMHRSRSAASGGSGGSLTTIDSAVPSWGGPSAMPLPRNSRSSNSKNSNSNCSRSRSHSRSRWRLPRKPQSIPDAPQSQWIDWVASSIEFFGCEPGSGATGPRGDVTGRALMLQQPAPFDHGESSATNNSEYLRLHEDFFDALLKEQVERASSLPSEPPSLPPASAYDRDESFGSLGTSISSTSTHTHETFNSLSSTRTHKRRRPLRLNKSSPRLNRVARVTPIEAYDSKYNPALPPPKQVSIDTILHNHDLHDPQFYVHPNCLLQKDKGKGDALGHSLSAKGRESCLNKLREKIALVVQVAGEENKPSTGMKRRPAKLSQQTSAYVETRSIIELRMGFLSMQYGLLLRWETQNNKIMFIVLRKMCHDAFYTKIPAILPDNNLARERKRMALRQLQRDSLPLVIRSSVGNQAIYQRMEGTEVVLVDTPFRVPQPQEFPPSNLTIIIHSILGLSEHSRWTISMTFDGHTEMAQLHHNQDRGFLESLRAPMKWQLNSDDVNSFELAGLEIRLFEQPMQRTNKYQPPTLPSKLTTSMTLPLGELVAQPAAKPSTLLHLTMPFTHDSNTQLTLELSHESEYAHWLYKELYARQLEENPDHTMTALLPSSKGLFDSDDVPDFLSVTSDSSASYSSTSKSTAELLDWFCGFCFKGSYC